MRFVIWMWRFTTKIIIGRTRGAFVCFAASLLNAHNCMFGRLDFSLLTFRSLSIGTHLDNAQLLRTRNHWIMFLTTNYMGFFLSPTVNEHAFNLIRMCSLHWSVWTLYLRNHRKCDRNKWQNCIFSRWLSNFKTIWNERCE